MLHRLLACLALLTGLTVLGTPAQARETAVAAAQVEQPATQTAARIWAVQAVETPGVRRLRAHAPDEPASTVVRRFVATTLIGPDRALE